MLAGGKLDTTLLFDFEKMPDMKYTNTDNRIFITTNDGRIQDSWDYRKIIEPAYYMLKGKFPGIKYLALAAMRGVVRVAVNLFYSLW